MLVPVPAEILPATPNRREIRHRWPGAGDRTVELVFAYVKDQQRYVAYLETVPYDPTRGLTSKAVTLRVWPAGRYSVKQLERLAAQADTLLFEVLEGEPAGEVLALITESVPA